MEKILRMRIKKGEKSCSSTNNKNGMALNESKREFSIPKFNQKYFKQGIKNVIAKNTLTFYASSSPSSS